MSYYFHNVPGRLRVKTPSVKGSEQKANEVKGLLSVIDGVIETSVNTLTGSIVVNYDHRVVGAGEITEELRKHGHFDMSRARTNDEYIQNAASKTGQFLGKVLFGAFIEKSLEGSVLSLLAVLI